MTYSEMQALVLASHNPELIEAALRIDRYIDDVLEANAYQENIADESVFDRYPEEFAPVEEGR